MPKSPPETDKVYFVSPISVDARLQALPTHITGGSFFSKSDPYAALDTNGHRGSVEPRSLTGGATAQSSAVPVGGNDSSPRSMETGRNLVSTDSDRSRGVAEDGSSVGTSRDCPPNPTRASTGRVWWRELATSAGLNAPRSGGAQW